MMLGKKVIAVLPAFNAVRTLRQTLTDIPLDVVDDIILVDDASTDGTAQLSRELGIHTIVHERNRGYGGNQKTCYREALDAGADIVIMVHPDHQYDPTLVPQMVRPIAQGKADTVFGSRMLIPGGARTGGMPIWKYWANVVLTAVGNVVLGMRLSEFHSGFRAYSRDVLTRVPFHLNSEGFVFDTEIIVQMKVAGYRIKEIPIPTKYFKDASTVGMRQGIRYARDIFVVLGRYLLHQWGIARRKQFSIT